MATISKSGIALSSIIQPSHTLNIINALDGTDTTDIVISGSLSSLQLVATGSLKGSSSYAVSSSLATSAATASYVQTAQTASYVQTASYSLTASYVANASSFPYTGSAIISGSLTVTGSLNVNDPSMSTTNVILMSSGSNKTIAQVKALSVSADGYQVTGDRNGGLNLKDLGKDAGAGLCIPTSPPNAPEVGSMYVDFVDGRLYIYNGSDYVYAALN